jgi:transcriptional regulator with XRE-family HTH domain
MTTTPNEGVTAALRAAMGEQRVNASELGRRLGRSHMWAARRLNGEVALTIDDVHEIAKALDVDPAPLLSVPSTP